MDKVYEQISKCIEKNDVKGYQYIINFLLEKKVPKEYLFEIICLSFQKFGNDSEKRALFNPYVSCVAENYRQMLHKDIATKTREKNEQVNNGKTYGQLLEECFISNNKYGYRNVCNVVLSQISDKDELHRFINSQKIMFDDSNKSVEFEKILMANLNASPLVAKLSLKSMKK